MLLLACLFSLICFAKSASDVVVMNSTYFQNEIHNDQWLLEFYAPWCGHCKRMEPVWEKLATELKGKIRVGKVDGTVEKSLTGRFPIQGYPSIFFIKGSEVYEFKGSRTVEGFSHFARGGFASNPPLDYVKSPFGPLGFVKGKVMQLGLISLEFYEHIKNTFELPWYAAVAAVVLCGIVLTLTIALFLTMIMSSISKPKRD